MQLAAKKLSLLCFFHQPLVWGCHLRLEQIPYSIIFLSAWWPNMSDNCVYVSHFQDSTFLQNKWLWISSWLSYSPNGYVQDEGQAEQTESQLRIYIITLDSVCSKDRMLLIILQCASIGQSEEQIRFEKKCNFWEEMRFSFPASFNSSENRYLMCSKS